MKTLFVVSTFGSLDNNCDGWIRCTKRSIKYGKHVGYNLEAENKLHETEVK